jgi:23S rRNA (cytosine1962-C5)-methyltransferase
VAFELLARPWHDERILADDADLLVVDKPSGLVVHGGDERRAGDVVSRLRALLAERGSGDYLGVHQRLDKDASGVLAFVRSPEHNAPVAHDFERHAAQRSYQASVLDPGLPEHGELEHRLAPAKDGRMAVVSRGGKLARSKFSVRLRADGRALLELRTETGRTHQLRVQLAAAGAPIAGDTLYGGAECERLLLHATELTLPALGRSFSAPPPARFREWVLGEPLTLGRAARLRQALRDAALVRWPLVGHADSYRLVNDLGDGLPGVTLDRYGDFALLSLSSDEAIERRQQIAELAAELGARGVYLKLRVRADLRRADLGELAPNLPIVGEPAPAHFLVREGELSFGVALADGLSTGLFVDQRDNRQLIAELARGGRVLNLFAYTCSFSVAAAKAGARETVSVDLSSRALERGRQNFADSGLAPDAHQFVRADVLEWLRRARRREQRYSLIVLDPPSFGTGEKKTFDMARGYRALATDALALLEPGGRLLAVTNHRKTSRQRLRKLIHEAARSAERRVIQMKDLPSPLDCPPRPDGPHPSKSVLVTVA